MLRRRAVRVVLVTVLVIAVAFGAVVVVHLTRTPPLTPAEKAAIAQRRLVRAEARVARRAEDKIAVSLPRRTGPEPALPDALYRSALPSHEVFSFLPWWDLSEVTAEDLSDSSEVAYFGLTVEKDGSLLRSDEGYQDLATGLADPALEQARADGDATFLSLTATSPPAITTLLSKARASAATLAGDCAPILSAHNFAGVDIDIEGTQRFERASFVTFVATFAKDLSATDPGVELVLDTYAGSAGSSHDFFDVKKLAPLVDRIFVMAYDMEDPGTAGSTDPLVDPSRAPNDVQSVLQYKKLVPAGKLILGMPFYGNDFTTLSSSSHAVAATSTPVAVTYAAVVSAAHQAQWNPTVLSPYASFKEKGKWHVTYYDDPLSLALRTALASNEHLAGVGAWAIGMDGENPGLIAALTGGSPLDRAALSGP